MYIFNYVHITKGSVSTAFAPAGFFFFKSPSWKGEIFNVLPMCVRISDSVAFWWPAATRSKEIKFFFSETSCITHAHTHIHTNTPTHIHTHTHTFLEITFFRQWQTEIEKTLSKKLSSSCDLRLSFLLKCKYLTGKHF